MQQFLEKCQTRTLRVLAERKIGENLWLGLTDEYAEVQLYAEADIQGQFVTVRFTDIQNGLLIGEIV